MIYKDCTIGDIASISAGGDRPKLCSDTRTSELTVPVYSNGLENDGLYGYTDKAKIDGDTVTVSARGVNVGTVCYREEAYLPIVRLLALVPRRDIIDAKYLYYVLKNTPLIGNGSAQPQITVPMISNQRIRIHEDLIIQKKIATYLSRFDELIRLNRGINENLAQQAQAVFKSWFITSEDRTTWKTGTFSDLIDSTLSGDWGKDSATGNFTEMVYCVRGADIPELKAGNKGKMPTRYILPKNYAAKQLVPGDIVIEVSGGSPTQSTGRAAAISRSLLDRYDRGMVCTNFCRAIKPKDGYSMFVYYYWQYLYDRRIFFAYENGTTGIKNLDLNRFITTEEIQIPPESLISQFNDYCKVVFDQIFSNGYESEQLATMRDMLLPRLMTGDLDVSKIELQ